MVRSFFTFSLPRLMYQIVCKIIQHKYIKAQQHKSLTLCQAMLDVRIHVYEVQSCVSIWFLNSIRSISENSSTQPFGSSSFSNQIFKFSLRFIEIHSINFINQMWWWKSCKQSVSSMKCRHTRQTLGYFINHCSKWAS